MQDIRGRAYRAVSSDSRETIRQLLGEHHTLTLATSSGGRPWAASVFYASDARLNLFFVSDHHTRHAQDMLANSQVMATVNADCQRWHDVRGLQIRGRGEKVPDGERAGALDLFLDKFADIRAIFDGPASPDERVLAKRLRATSFFRIVPAWVRIIDSSRGFGFSREFDLGSGS